MRGNENERAGGAEDKVATTLGWLVAKRRRVLGHDVASSVYMLLRSTSAVN
jgi:hypothetical protein